MNETETKFYIELPADEYGNTAYAPAVIAAQYLPAGREPLRPLDNTKHPYLTVTGPPEFAAKWPSMYEDSHGGWAETEGPARMLSRNEWEAITGRILAARTAS